MLPKLTISNLQSNKWNCNESVQCKCTLVLDDFLSCRYDIPIAVVIFNHNCVETKLSRICPCCRRTTSSCQQRRRTNISAVVSLCTCTCNEIIFDIAQQKWGMSSLFCPRSGENRPRFVNTLPNRNLNPENFKVDPNVLKQKWKLFVGALVSQWMEVQQWARNYF